jgi:hypothetical protein
VVASVVTIDQRTQYKSEVTSDEHVPTSASHGFSPTSTATSDGDGSSSMTGRAASAKKNPPPVWNLCRGGRPGSRGAGGRVGVVQRRLRLLRLSLKSGERSRKTDAEQAAAEMTAR